MDWINADLDDLRRRNLHRTRRKIESGQGVEVRWRLRDCVNFSSNDYLAYAGDPRLVRAATRALLRFGVGAGSSPLVSGYLPPLHALERDLAAWLGTQAALVFSSGFAGHIAVITALAGRGDVLFSDALNHASLIDGCRLSRAEVRVYEHNHLEQLETMLAEAKEARRRIIVSDSVFSMDGDTAAVQRLLELAHRHDALLILDEAHALGVLGEHGRGMTDDLPDNADRSRLIKLGTLSKALGSQGGFVVASCPVIELLINRARPYIFSTALAPALAAAARRAVFLIGQEPDRRAHLLGLAKHLRERLHALGWNIGPSSTHIIPVIVGEESRALELSKRLAAKRLLVPAIRPPSVPEGASRLRISLTAGHTMEDVERLVAAMQPTKSSS